MIISIVGGSGPVGTALGTRLAMAGHTVTIGARDPTSDKAAAAVAAVKKAATLPDSICAATVPAACDAADIILLTTPGMPTAELFRPIAESMGSCAGKPIIDATNPLSPWPELDISADRNTTCASEELAMLFPECPGIYKAFNTVGVEVLADPSFNGIPATMLYSGPAESEAADAFQSVTKVIADSGFEPVYVGGPRQGRNLESLGEMWIHMALRYKDMPYHKKASNPRAFGWSVLYR